MGAISVSTLSQDDLGRLQPLLRRSRQKPHRFLLNDLHDTLDSLWLGEFAALSSGQAGQVFVALDENHVVGTAAYDDLPWETRILGKPMGALKHIAVAPDTPRAAEVVEQLLHETTDWAESRAIEFLLCKSYTDDLVTIHALEKSGFLLMDTLLDYVYFRPAATPPESDAPPLPNGATIRLANDRDVPELVTMAHAAFGRHFGRFHADERIAASQAVRVYEEWIRASCEGYADWVLVATVNSRIAGYSVWKKPSALEQRVGLRLGHYSIGAVHPDYHGQGLFGALTHAGMAALDGIADYIEGPTHINNYPVQRGYTRLHWRLCDARHSFHKWLR